ncbi:MAG: hypothetical protein JSS09_03615, partial [Verrucomicrobia bacterium]|nr:hypothetical protein [Verrucomicrobiota bacterium]
MSQGGSVRGVNEEHHSFQGKSGKQAKFQGHIVQVEAGASSLQKSFFSHLSQHFQRQESPLFSADARHTQYLVNDVLGFGRNFLQIFGLNSNAQNLLGGSGGAALGVTGLEVLQKGEQDLELANRALDKKAEESANLTWKIGASEMAMGGFGAAFRGLSTASNLE